MSVFLLERFLKWWFALETNWVVFFVNSITSFRTIQISIPIKWVEKSENAIKTNSCVWHRGALTSFKTSTYFSHFIVIRKRMKILQNSQKYFATLGIGSEQIKRQSLLNGKILIGFILLGYSLTGNSIYLIFEATSFDEYIECICSIVGIVVISTCFVTMVFGLTTLLDCIDDIESLIGTSECTNSFLKNIQLLTKQLFLKDCNIQRQRPYSGKPIALLKKLAKLYSLSLQECHHFVQCYRNFLFASLNILLLIWEVIPLNYHFQCGTWSHTFTLFQKIASNSTDFLFISRNFKATIWFE